jgi:hypothetical protein
VNIGELEFGLVTSFIYTITNYGLIRADDVRLQIKHGVRHSISEHPIFLYPSIRVHLSVFSFFRFLFSCLPVSQWHAQSPSSHSLGPPLHQILSTLGSSVKEGRSTAALVIGKLAAIEVPRGLWNDLVPLLLHNVQAAPTKDLKQSTFEALGYVCEEVPEHLQAHSNGVLVAVASGMSADETDASVKLAATTALGNSLEFIKTNMSVEVRRRSLETDTYACDQQHFAVEDWLRIPAHHMLHS